MIAKDVEKVLIKASRELSLDVFEAIKTAREKETNVNSKNVLNMIIENLNIAKSSNIPMCQDTGMLVAIVTIGKNCSLSISEIEEQINKGALFAFEKGLYRKSIVKDPLFDRENTKTNLPIVFHYIVDNSVTLKINFILKGFGSENCSSIKMLNPTSTEEDIINTIVDMVKVSGAKSCPPIILGIGIGGTLDKAVLLSKVALTRKLNIKNENIKYNRLEEKIKDRVNELNIGSGGVKGDITVLKVRVESYPTHIAGMPLALQISCWADRKAEIIYEKI